MGGEPLFQVIGGLEVQVVPYYSVYGAESDLVIFPTRELDHQHLERLEQAGYCRESGGGLGPFEGHYFDSPGWGKSAEVGDNYFHV